MEGQMPGEGLLCFAIRAAVETVGEIPVGVANPWSLPANAATVPCTLHLYDDGRPAETGRRDYLHYPHQAVTPPVRSNGDNPTALPRSVSEVHARPCLRLLVHGNCGLART